MRDIMLRFVLLFIFVVCMMNLQHVEANIGDYDDHWIKKEDAAKWNAAKAYNPNPHGVVNKLNLEVRKYVLFMCRGVNGVGQSRVKGQVTFNPSLTN